MAPVRLPMLATCSARDSVGISFAQHQIAVLLPGNKTDTGQAREGGRLRPGDDVVQAVDG
ncbi:hypothetical protein GCM10027202_08870 [Microvirgula curvata]